MELREKDVLKIIELNENPPKPSKRLIKVMDKYLKNNTINNNLDCPFDFTSRCTLGRCNCKQK